MRPSSRALITLLVTGSASSSLAIKEFDSCGVLSSDFLNDEFLGKYRVAGPEGCALEGNAASDCFCGPEIDGEERLGEWIWQCGKNITFGPVAPKTCPEVVPVPSLMGDLDKEAVDFMREAKELDCDPSIHPTGFPGDEVCSYSTCDEGGDFTAVCACVDLSRMGIEGSQWHCLHSTCSCGVEDKEAGDGAGASSAAYQNKIVAAAGAAAIATALALLN